MKATIAQFGRVFRLRAHEVDSEQGRADERHRRIALSAIASALAKLIAVASVLISVPLTLNYLGPERFAIWMMISSLVAILAFADLGIGNGLLNAVASANGRDDRPEMRRYISSAYLTLTGVALCLLVFFAASYRFVPWPALFNVKTALAMQESGPAIAAFFVCFVLAVPLGLVQRVQIALQMSFTASLWQCVASLLGLAGVIAAVRMEAGLPWLVLALFGAPLLVSLVNSVVFFGWRYPDLAPQRRYRSGSAAVKLLRIGGLFLVLQIVAALAYASDGFIIAQLLGADRVADYAVIERMFSVVSMVLTFGLSPLWPAYGEAIARKDGRWVRQTLGRSIRIATALAAAMSLALVFLGPTLIQWWIPGRSDPSLLVLLALAIWKPIEIGSTALAVFMNGANVVGLQLIVASATLAAALTLKVLLVPQIGISGVVWATSVAYLLFAALPYAFLLPAVVRRATGQVEP